MRNALKLFTLTWGFLARIANQGHNALILAVFAIAVGHRLTCFTVIKNQSHESRTTMAKDRQHFLPASWIARFSEEDKQPLRDRQVWVYRVNNSKAWRTAASRIAFQNKMYNIDAGIRPPGQENAVDKTWCYEGELDSALDRLINQETTLEDFLNILVPFVGSIFARTPIRREILMAEMKKHRDENPLFKEIKLSKSNININRLRDAEIHSSRSLFYQWIVVEMDSDTVLPDIGTGFGLNYGSRNVEVFIRLIPIGLRHILCLVPFERLQILSLDKNGNFQPIVEYQKERDLQEDLTMLLLDGVQDFVIGSRSRIENLDLKAEETYSTTWLADRFSYWPFFPDGNLVEGILDRVKEIALDRNFAAIYNPLKKYESLQVVGNFPTTYYNCYQASDFLDFNPKGLWSKLNYDPRLLDKS